MDDRNAEWEIRPGREADAEVLSVLALETWPATYLHAGISPAYAHYMLTTFSPEGFATALRSGEAGLLVASGDGGLGGYARFAPTRDAELLPHGATELETLYVRPALQGRGLGHLLLAGVIERTRAEGAGGLVMTVNSENRRALSFYARQGLRDRGEWLFHLDGEAIPNRIISLPIPPAD